MDRDIPMRDADTDSDLEDAVPATPEAVPNRLTSITYTTTTATADTMQVQTYAAAAFNKQLLAQAASRHYAAEQHFNTVGSQPTAWQRLMVDGAELQRESFVKEHFGPQTSIAPAYPELQAAPAGPASRMYMTPTTAHAAGVRPAFVQGLSTSDVWSNYAPLQTNQRQHPSAYSGSTSASSSDHVPTQRNSRPGTVAKSAQYGWDMSVGMQGAKPIKPRKPWEEDQSEEEKVGAEDEEEEVYVPRPTRTRGAGKTV
nr:hypothetical protein B0A51_16027 [Rachicladosporium sp. CCFEE 5018]